MGCKKQMDKIWAMRKTNWGRVKKKLVSWGIREKCGISRIGCF